MGGAEVAEGQGNIATDAQTACYTMAARAHHGEAPRVFDVLLQSLFYAVQLSYIISNTLCRLASPARSCSMV